MRFGALLVLFTWAMIGATIFAFTQSVTALITGALVLALWAFFVLHPLPKYEPRHLRTDR